MSNRLSFSKIIKIASWWKSAGGSSKVEVAALEPLLWKDGNYKIHDIISMLKDMGFIVTMTTNGSTLSKHANYLKKAGLDLLRVSCHSLDPEIFRKISIEKGCVPPMKGKGTDTPADLARVPSNTCLS